MLATALAQTVVLVHGAFADGSSWEKVIPILQAKGLEVIAVQNPLTSLADDVAATNRALNEAKGPVVLVGHSWGGVVITEAGVHDKVKSLVYVAAFAPDKGESALDAAKAYPPTPGFLTFKFDAEGFAKIPEESMIRNFAQDIPASQARILYATQGPTAAKCLQEKVSRAAWQSKPTWFIVAQHDRIISPAQEKAHAEKMGATTLVLPTSHVPFLSKPNEVAAVILAAAGYKAKGTTASDSRPEARP